MAKGSKPPGPARRVAWSIASDINVVAIYRIASGAMFLIITGLIGWLGSNLVSGQADIARQMAVGNVNISNAAGLIDAANHRIDMLVGRVNENDRRLTIVETRMTDGTGRGR